MAQTKVIKDRVIAFRLTPAQFEAFRKKHTENPILGVKSPGMLARKLALDMSMDKLTWKDKKISKLAPEVYMATAPVSVPA